jgi:tetratricopeptide (TPR) repeat protein
MISSTARDLPEHREEAMKACLRQGMFPIMMENLPASDDEAIPASLKMVDEADIYLLILAHRYGYVPDANNPTRISVTEHEYNRAVERKIPILTFVMHEDHPVKAADVEKGEGSVKLEAFKQRALLKVANFFKSPADLRADVIDSLSDHRHRDVTSFHYVTEIPAPPTEFIAHPYTLLQTNNLVGRQKELKLLTDWIIGKDLEFDSHKAPADSVRIMSVVAIGGMGKSALTWKWFNDVAPQEMKNLAGRMWWSFYESDATFENFIIRALAYVSRRTIDQVMEIPESAREPKLLAALDRQPFLFVLDGLERILIAYARMDAVRLDDIEVGKEKNLRKTADPRVGSFLKKLAQAKASRVLVSSRLYPTELETSGGDPIPGSFRVNIEGLSDEDAAELWSAFGTTGSRVELLAVFKAFGAHPLLIQVLAGEVRRYRQAPGNFDEWRRRNGKFDPRRFPKTETAMTHVLEFALLGLNAEQERTLHTIAAFRMPAAYATLVALLVGRKGRKFRNEQTLDQVLTELEDRGLLGWDQRANRYDLHPIVRTVVWHGLSARVRAGIFTQLRNYFSDACEDEDVNEASDLTGTIELYNSLLELKRYGEAFEVYSYRLHDRLNRLGASLTQIELLQPLADGRNELPPLEDAQSVFDVMIMLGEAFTKTGQLNTALHFFCQANCLSISSPMLHGPYNWLLGKVSLALLMTGYLQSANRAAIESILPRKDPHESLAILAAVLAARGKNEESSSIIRQLRSERLKPYHDSEMWPIAQANLWLERPTLLDYITSEFNLRLNGTEIEYIWMKRMKGESALRLGDLQGADNWLHDVISVVRTINLVQEELPAGVAMAELRRRQGDVKAARELLDDVWELAERGPYPLFHADAFNVLTQIERDEGNTTAAIEAATKAYRLAWCDGPPFAYHWGLEKAKHHLKELGAPHPEMPPFDESKFEPMPEVEINPRDEFYVDDASLDMN